MSKTKELKIEELEERVEKAKQALESNPEDRDNITLELLDWLFNLGDE